MLPAQTGTLAIDDKSSWPLVDARTALVVGSDEMTSRHRTCERGMIVRRMRGWDGSSYEEGSMAEKSWR